MSQQLTVIARIESHAGKIDFVKSELLKLIEPTKKEQGCIQYDLHQDNEKPTAFLFYERWSSTLLWQKHMKSEHLMAFIKNTEGVLADLDISQMSLVS